MFMEREQQKSIKINYKTFIVQRNIDDNTNILMVTVLLLLPALKNIC